VLGVDPDEIEGVRQGLGDGRVAEGDAGAEADLAAAQLVTEGDNEFHVNSFERGAVTG